MKKVLLTLVMMVMLMTPALKADDVTYEEDSRAQIWRTIQNDITISTFVDFYIVFTLEVGYWMGW